MGKKTTRTARFLFCADAWPVLPLFRRPRGLKSEASAAVFLAAAALPTVFAPVSFGEKAHTEALRRGSLLFAAAKLSFAPTKPLFAPAKPSFAAAKQNASDSKSLKKRTCKGQNCSYASANGKDAARRKREAPPKETTGKRPCEAGRCKSICQGLSSVTAYFYFFIATFALRQWAVQILHR